ncbi:hypothetical protein F6J84_14755 [Microbacterium caowuchunii]|uniref:hypothetical protein n=1 Tax=Microbacterium caowuchunii TaxID=2614638 RepID=UPI001247F8EE|nr:hypothetical protein [Microbacterium caowuchunii]QEW01230.1 hypothetical protein F6J84_14755 [Microbacterium caowuchunii]
MAIGYRAILRLTPDEDAVAVAESQLRSWLGGKKNRRSSGAERSDWDGPGVHDLGGDSELVVVHAAESLDQSRRRLYRLRERNRHGVWTVSLYAISAPQARRYPQSLVIEAGVDEVPTSTAVSKVDTPRLARQILETTNARDGETPLHGVPSMIRSSDIDEVWQAIVDPARTASVIVAPALEGAPPDRWQEIITSLTKQSVGVATTFVLDPEATELLAMRLPHSHRIERGVVRTFAPQVELDSAADGIRHRMLGPATLARAIDGTRVATPLVNRHAESTRLRFIQRDLPPDVRRSLEILARADLVSERAQEVRRRLAHPTPSSTPERIRDEVPSSASPAQETSIDPGFAARLGALLKRWVGVEKVTQGALESLESLLTTSAAELSVATEQIDGAIADIETNDAELRGLRTSAEELSFDLAVSDEQVRSLEREVQILRRRLIEADLATETHVEPVESIWDPPYDIAELVARITPGDEAHPAASRIVFTGDVDTALEIDVREKTPRYAYAFWDYVHVLYDYAEGKLEGRITSGLHAYLKSDTLDGHKCPPDRHAPTESDSVLNRAQWRAERMLPVPQEVSDTGRVLMDAHFKPTWRDSFAPRMHYYDDTARTGKIYIGYIGRHLKNTKS